VRQQWGIKKVSLRPRSKRATPATNSVLASPQIGGRGGHLVIACGEQSNSETLGGRDARTLRRAESVPSPVQNRARVRFTISQLSYFSQYFQASLASERCWEVHKKCCITGIKGIAGSKPKDIVSMHIWQHAYQSQVRPLFQMTVNHIKIPSVVRKWRRSALY